jgi:hypothetical protein
VVAQEIEGSWTSKRTSNSLKGLSEIWKQSLVKAQVECFFFLNETRNYLIKRVASLPI